MGARGKFEDAAHAFAGMERAQSEADFRRSYSACLSALRSVAWVLEKDSKAWVRKRRRADAPRLNEFWIKVEAFAKADPLLKWARDTRDADLHRGETNLEQGGIHIDRFDSREHTPPEPGAVLEISLSGPRTGAYWVTEGEAGEQVFHQINAPGIYREMYVSDAPPEHLGKPLVGTSPVELCREVIRYYVNLAGQLELDFGFESVID